MWRRRIDPPYDGEIKIIFDPQAIKAENGAEKSEEPVAEVKAKSQAKDDAKKPQAQPQKSEPATGKHPFGLTESHWAAIMEISERYGVSEPILMNGLQTHFGSKADLMKIVVIPPKIRAPID